ncbi:MAG: hypothetical protein HOP10_01810 [Chitinophagaceae bacterium]|nr:hypothetical protein [Chitinophagaceae bacterium]
MKRIVIVLSGLLLIAFTACKSSDKKSGDNDLKATADSLYKNINAIHGKGMADYMKIEKKQEAIKSLLDSIAKLPSNAKTAAEPLKTKLNETMDALTKAYDDMYNWMPTLNMDSAQNDLQKRVDYFTKEKLNAENINQALSNSLQKADSLLKAKF